VPPRPPVVSFDSLRAACSELEVDLAPTAFELLARYAALVRDWNARVNLVSRRDVGRLLSYHVVDSLAAARFIPPDARCCDVGTGAGLPGIPLAIVRPGVRMVLVESTGKKCRFLASALSGLGLTNAEVVCGRSEELETLGCDVVLSRLTGPLRTTLKHLAHHARPGGSVVLYKNPHAAEEPATPLLSKLGLVRGHVLDLTLPLCRITRRFLVLLRA